MPPWLGTGIVLAVVAVIFGMILFSQIRNKRRGRTGCGCGCEHCAMRCGQKSESTGKERK